MRKTEQVKQGNILSAEKRLFFYETFFTKLRTTTKLYVTEQRDETYRKTKMAKVAKGTPRNLAYLLINCSRPCLLSSIKDSSKIPSSPRKGSCRFKAFPGSGGTTILLSRCSSFFSHSKSL